MQQIGETRDALIEDNNKRVQEIVDHYKDKTEPYWIVLFAKPAKANVEGKPALIQVVKPYFTKPSPQVGMVYGEVNNKKGQIKWVVNMPQAPFDYNGLLMMGAQEANEMVVETTEIPQSYITK